MDRVAAFKFLERAAQPLRRAGLGRFVDRARGSFERGLGEFTSEVDGFRLTGKVALHTGYIEELRDEGREGYMTELFADAARPGTTVVDVGAHVGFLTLVAARAVGETGRVVAIEPNPDTLPLLRRNIADNGFTDRVTVVDRALTATPGEVSFFAAPAGDTSSLVAQGAGSRAVRVAAITLDALLEGERAPAAIKVDVEGGEPAALAGMRETIARAGPNLRLFVECNPEALVSGGSTPDMLAAELGSLGLMVSVIDEQARSLRPFDDLDDISGYVNLVCVPRSR